MSDGEQQDNAQKTEEPTAKKIEESRKKGQVAISREVNNWVMLFVGTIMVAALSPFVFTKLTVIMTSYLENAHAFPADKGGIGDLLSDSYMAVMVALAFPFIFFTLAAFFSPFLQVGPLFAPEAIKPDFSKVSPIKGFQRLFSLRSLMEFAKGILKIATIAVVGVIILYPYFDKFEHLIGLPMPMLLIELKTLVVKLMIGVLIALIIIAVIDLVFQRQQHHQKLKMTKQEVKDEYKQTEGDPHVRAKLRQLRGERARQRIMQAVPSADVVITNPTHFSIALKYDPETMEAPLCVAKGIDEVALRIREVAKEHNIILFENKPLARALYDTVDIDETIPAEQYKAVAEVISYVFQQRGQR